MEEGSKAGKKNKGRDRGREGTWEKGRKGGREEGRALGRDGVRKEGWQGGREEGRKGKGREDGKSKRIGAKER